jgi:hypothetical protein
MSLHSPIGWLPYIANPPSGRLHGQTHRKSGRTPSPRCFHLMNDMRPTGTLPQVSPRGAFWLGLMLVPAYVLVILALLADASMRVAAPASLLAWALAVLSFAIGAGIFLPGPRRCPWLLRGWLGLSLVLPLGLAVLPGGGWSALGVASAGVLAWSVLCLAAHRMGGAESPVQTFALPLNRAANPLAWRHVWAGAALLLAGLAAMAATEHLLGDRLRSAALLAALALVPLGVLLAPRGIPGRMLGGMVPLAQWFVFEATAVDRGLLGGARQIGPAHVAVTDLQGAYFNGGPSGTNSIYGGGGGGNANSSGFAAGTSVFGGAGGTGGGTVGAPGTVPGGGGGAPVRNGPHPSGAGARGEVRVTVIV